MSFTTPLALLLLLSLPYIYWLGRPKRNFSLRGRWRDWSSLVLRGAILLLLVLALSGAQSVRAADELAVVFLVDASDSVTPALREEAENYVRTAMAEMGPNDRAAVILFGANALVERPMSGLAELAPVSSVPQPLNTDLAEAVRLALAIFPAGAGRRIVILSDGAATIGNSVEAARLAATSGVQIDYVPLQRPAGDAEALITAVDAPNRVTQGESFTVHVTVESNRNMAATLRILAEGSVVHEEPVNLTVGANTFQVRLQTEAQEFARYQAEIVPAEDTYYQNNQMAAFTEIVGAPRVLVVAPDGTLDDSGNPVPDEAPQLILALEATGLAVDRTTPEEFPVSLAQVSSYASIILVNVNAKDLTPRKMETIQIYVRDLGGGLVAVGGPESYGMGGYFRTALEETLPVNMQIQDQERFPSVTMVIVIDRSGSMGAQEGSLTKIQLAAEGAVRVVELLNDFDVISVIPVDTQPSGMIGPASASERDNLIGQIRQIGAGGGGIYVRTGMEEAANVLADNPSEVQHIILLADGSDSEEKEGVPELIEGLAAEGVTVTTVSIGDGPDTPWLADMAALGNGRFHLTDRASNLPEIFTQETTAIQRSYLVEERFFPTLVQQSPILAGIREVPALQGYVGTEAKATARVVLETHLGDPLLATWQYGLGRAVAWTSDATDRWGAQWVAWDGFPVFWAQAVLWTMTDNRDSNVESIIEYE
ncbi:MAG: VWA domain-containing protein, partial [Anaerolineales bacterium]|nr:VWA domain-containing protein [Anaerolineales bacterium]